MQILLLLGAVLVANIGAQQAQWYPVTVTPPPPHDGGAMAYDSMRDRVVLAGGAQSVSATFPQYYTDTLEWDGAHWVRRANAACPHVYGHQMAFDPLRQRLVMWGGETRGGDPPGIPVLSTWEYDGASWRWITNVGPVSRTGHVMTYDPVMQRVLMFGGYGNATWSWDGTAWTVVNAPGPPGRRFPAHAYDTTRNRWVIFGGREISTSTLLDDLWEWDGTAWTQRHPANSPPPVLGSMAFDARRDVAVLNAGTNGPGTNGVADLWEWNGTAWAHVLTRSLDHSLGAAVWHGGTGAVVFFGPSQSDVWDGANLVGLPVGYPFRLPLSRLSPLGTQLLLVTAAHVWQWHPGEWQLVGGAFPGRYDAEINVVEDTVRNRLVCVVPSGGLGSYVNEWDGLAWDGPIGGIQFSRRRLPAVAFDRVRGKTVLFGGAPVGASGLLQDTWEWQFGLWQLRTPAHAPSPRWDAAMGWDPQLGEVLLFGGSTVGFPANYVNDTWTFDGIDWQQLAPAPPPPAMPMDMVLHEAEGRPYLFSRLPASPGCWRWTGSNWQATAIPAGNVHASAFDRGRGQFVTGDVVPAFFGLHVAPAVIAGGTGCGTPRPRLQLSSPYLGNPSLAFDVDQALPASAAALVLGTQAASLSLPGACTLSVGGATSTRFFLTGPGGFASLHKTVPPAASLLGATLHAQVFVLDLPAAGLTASDSQVLTVGN